MTCGWMPRFAMPVAADLLRSCTTQGAIPARSSRRFLAKSQPRNVNTVSASRGTLSRSALVVGDIGIVWGRPFFVLAPGNEITPVLKSISSHRRPAISPRRWAVRINNLIITPWVSSFVARQTLANSSSLRTRSRGVSCRLVTPIVGLLAARPSAIAQENIAEILARTLLALTAPLTVSTLPSKSAICLLVSESIGVLCNGRADFFKCRWTSINVFGLAL